MSEFFELGDPIEQPVTGCTMCATMKRRLEAAQDRLNEVEEMVGSLPRTERKVWASELAAARRAKEVVAVGLLNHRCREHSEPMNEHHHVWGVRTEAEKVAA